MRTFEVSCIYIRRGSANWNRWTIFCDLNSAYNLKSQKRPLKRCNTIQFVMMCSITYGANFVFDYFLLVSSKIGVFRGKFQNCIPKCFERLDSFETSWAFKRKRIRVRNFLVKSEVGFQTKVCTHFCSIYILIVFSIIKTYCCEDWKDWKAISFELFRLKLVFFSLFPSSLTVFIVWILIL